MIFITEPAEGNSIIILAQWFHGSTNEEIISDTSKFEKLIEDAT